MGRKSFICRQEREAPDNVHAARFHHTANCAGSRAHLIRRRCFLSNRIVGSARQRTETGKPPDWDLPHRKGERICCMGDVLGQIGGNKENTWNERAFSANTGRERPFFFAASVGAMKLFSLQFVNSHKI